jgi:hypothetical protein
MREVATQGIRLTRAYKRKSAPKRKRRPKEKGDRVSDRLFPDHANQPGGRAALHVIRMYGIIPQISVNAREFRVQNTANIDNDINS